MSDFYGDVHIKAGYPVKAGESIMAGEPLAVTEDGYAINYDASSKFIGYAVLPVNNTNGIDGEKSVAVAIDGLMVDDISDLVIGTTQIGAALFLDANNKPVCIDTDPATIGKIIAFLGGKRAVYRIIFE